MRIWMMAALTVGCGEKQEDTGDGTYVTIDADGDGVSIPDGDCDDNNANVNPNEDEIPGNGIDDDCDDEIDETS